MFKKLIIIMALILLPFTTVNASPDYSGVHMFTELGNDNDVDKIENLVNTWFLDNGILYESDLEYYEKLEDYDSGNSNYKAYFEFDGGKTSGTWETDDPVIFYSLKAGNKYAMYWLEVPKQEGIFSTEYYLTNKKDIAQDLSHITFYTNHNTYDTTHTPEPGTLVLLGLGLLSIAKICRKGY